jgi:hypothetical protein
MFKEFSTDNILREENNYFFIDVDNFMKNHQMITDRYEHTSTYSDFNPKSIISVIDRYSLQLSEEICEFVNEEDLEQRQFELLDIIGYTATTIHVILSYIRTRQDINIDPIVISRSKDTIPCYSGTGISLHSFSNILFSNIFFNARRKFPERKWHKKYDAASEEQVLERLIGMYEIYMQVLRESFKYWSDVYGLDCFIKFYSQKLQVIQKTFI